MIGMFYDVMIDVDIDTDTLVEFYPALFFLISLHSTAELGLLHNSGTAAMLTPATECPSFSTAGKNQ